jgi:membrane-associated PAP2 superfamily phosphatase
MSTPRRDWLPEAILLIALAIVATVVFAVTPLDVDAARVFYRSTGPDHWPLARQFPWSLLYELASPLTASLIVLGLLGLVAGHVRGREAWRTYGIFLILSIVVGPGLIVNAGLKDHWERPRPRDIVEFGGPLHYSPAPLPGEGGKSFPCGHCSVGFLFAAGWWVWKRRRPTWAYASLGLGLVVGVALGAGRMAGGGHFFSDVIWSALLTWGVTHALYYYVLRIPAYEARRQGVLLTKTSPLRLKRVTTVLAVLGATGVLVALFLTPHGRRFATNVDLASLPSPSVLEVTARTANIDILIGDQPATQMLVEGELHGFGLPTSRLDSSVEFRATPIPTLSYRIEQRGWITDLDASAAIRLPPRQLKRIVVRLEHGNIRVTDATRSHVVENRTLQLDLQTKAGVTLLRKSQ